MARTEIYQDRIVIKLSPSEKLLTVRRKDVVLARSLIYRALMTEDPAVFVRGYRVGAAVVPRLEPAGIFRHLSGRDFVLCKRGGPAVVLDLSRPDGSTVVQGGKNASDFSRIVFTTQHAREIVSILKNEDRDGSHIFEV